MKTKIFILILFAAASLSIYAQQITVNSSLYPPQQNGCVQVSDIASTGIAGANDLGSVGQVTTTYTNNNGHNGFMFDVVSVEEVSLDSFQFAWYQGTTAGNVSIYYKIGTYVGYESTPSAWTFLGSQYISGIQMINSLPTLTLPANTTYSLYITANLVTGNIACYDSSGTYTDGTVTLTCGAGISYQFGSTFSPKIWNGTVYYSSGSNGISDFVPGRNSQVQVYPNPSNNGNFTVDFGDLSFKSAFIRVYDVTGRIIREDIINNLTSKYSLSNLPSGFSMLTIGFDDEYIITRSIVVTE